MKVWKYVLRETEHNPLNQDFEAGFVKADSFDEAKTKVDERLKTTWKEIKLEIRSLAFELEVTIQ